MRMLALFVCAAALLVTACGGDEQPATAAKRPVLPELTSMGQLQAAFEAHQGVPRLLILLSPT